MTSLKQNDKENNVSGVIRSKHIKDSKERLFIMTQTHSLHSFGVIPFVKEQNN